MEISYINIRDPTPSARPFRPPQHRIIVMKPSRILVTILAFASLLSPVSAASVPEVGPETLTLRLTRLFDEAWNRGDLKAMYEMLDPECVFKSPFQQRIGRDAVRDKVFRNVTKLRDSHTTEEMSKVEGDLAYSFATLAFNRYDAGGLVIAHGRAKHLFIFTRRPAEDWKFRFMIHLEETEEEVHERK